MCFFSLSLLQQSGAHGTGKGTLVKGRGVQNLPGGHAAFETAKPAKHRTAYLAMCYARICIYHDTCTSPSKLSGKGEMLSMEYLY